MKKRLAAMAVILCMMTATACSGVDIDTLKHDAKGAVKIVKDSAEYSDKYKDIDVHTESEMREFALDALKSKYGKDFVIDESFCKYW